MQIRLRQTVEFPGSTVRQADIRFATNGIEVIGKPTNSPLLGESFEAETHAQVSNLPTNQQLAYLNDSIETAQFLGNLLEQNRNTISVGGALSHPLDVDWYKFTVDYQGIQAIAGFNSGGKTWATVFDIDYADGVGRPDTVISVFDELGNLVLLGRDSDITDDQPRTGQGADLADMSRGSAGLLDPYIGSVHLPEGTEKTYYVAIHSNATLPTALNARFESDSLHQLVRLEPIAGVRRVVEDHIGFTGYRSGTNFTGTGIYTDVLPSNTGPILGIDNALQLKAHVTPFTLGDVALYVSLGDVPSGLGPGQNRLLTVNPLTGEVTADVGPLGAGRFDYYTEVRDIVIRPDGQLYGYQNQRLATGFQDNNAGRLIQIDPSNANEFVIGNDTIPNDGEDEDTGPFADDMNTITSFRVDALAYRRAVSDLEVRHERYSLFYSVAGDFGFESAPGTFERVSRLFRANPNTGDASVDLGTAQNPQPWRGAIGDIQAKTAFNLVVTIDYDDELPHINTNRVTIEEGGTVTARITRTGPTAYPAFVQLQSSGFGADWDVNNFFVTIPAGERFVEVTIAAIDDNGVADGPRTVEFWAIGSTAGAIYDSVSDTLEVLDPGVDPATLPFLSVLTNNFTIAEPGFATFFPVTTVGTVTRSGSTANPVVVDLINHDPSEVIYTDLLGNPISSVTIAAGQSSAQFIVQAIDDFISDSTQTVKLTAAANGYLHGSSLVSVYSEKLDIGLPTGMAYLTLNGFDLIAPAGNRISDGHTFSISDVSQTVVFEFDSGGGVQPGRVAVPFNTSLTATQVAINIETAINNSGLFVETLQAGSRIVIVNGVGRDVRDSAVLFDDFSLGVGGQLRTA